MSVEDPERLARVEQNLANLVSRVYQLERARELRSMPPSPTVSPAAAAALETTLGTYWLSRLGIVSLITGVALLVVTYFGALGPLLRIALGYAMAGALVWIGARLSRRHATFGRVVFGGGLAIGYFVTYALHFVPAMRIVDSEALGVVLVAAAIAGIVAIAHRMKSETVAGIALFLGLHTGMLSDVTALSLVITTLLAAGAAFFLAANRWVIVPLSTVVAVYSTHATLALGPQGAALGPTILVGFLALDFALFAAAALIRPDIRARSQLLLAGANWLGVLVLGGHVLEPVSRDALFAFLCAFAATHALLAALARIRRAPHEVVATLLGLGVVTAALALPVRLAGWDLLAGWLALALASAVIARRTAWHAFGVVAIVLLAIAQGDARVAIHGAPAAAACMLAWLAVEQLHAPRDRTSALRQLLVGGVALAMLNLGDVAVRPELHTIAGVAIAFALFGLGFALRRPAYRWAAFATLALSTVRFLAVQLDTLSADQRIVTFVIAGVVLLLVSFAYTRRRTQA